MGQRIAVFDIDGTLTDTMDVDVECYETAVREVLELDIPATWADFDEITDTAIVEQACELAGRPPPGEGLRRQAAERVAALLEQALEGFPERFRPIPGARNVFGALRDAGWEVAMGTGAWRPSAQVKLRGAEIPTAGVPLATSTEHRARTDIIREAVTRAGVAPEARVVYVGDGVWDGRAAGRLGYRFLGVGQGARARDLTAAGASRVIPDLTPSGVLEALNAMEEGG